MSKIMKYNRHCYKTLSLTKCNKFFFNFQDWNKILNTNMTGSATNAEDFTKQFMSEMFGNNGAGKFFISKMFLFFKYLKYKKSVSQNLRMINGRFKTTASLFLFFHKTEVQMVILRC